MQKKKLKLHLGCGQSILSGYTNIDKFVSKIGVRKFDITKKMPFKDNSVDEILICQVLEHLSFFEEKQFFDEAYRLLKKGGKLHIEVPDGQWILLQWINANDNWIQFYNNKDNDYFGNGLDIKDRWSVLTAHIFGNQSNEGQFHKNIYTSEKLKNILLGYYTYRKCVIELFNYDKFGKLQCIRCIATK